MRDLYHSIENSFYGTSYRDICLSDPYNTPKHGRKLTEFFGITMEVPITDHFEIPGGLLNTFKLALQGVDMFHSSMEVPDCIVAQLYIDAMRQGYKSTEAVFREIMNSSFTHNRLRKIRIKETEDYYYGCNSILLNRDFVPILLFSWEVQKVGERKYKLIKPVMRISPVCFTEKRDSVQRFIIGKLLTTALDPYLCPSYIIAEPFEVNQGDPKWGKLKVAVEDIPLKIKRTMPPSINQSNSDFIKVALDYKDDLFK